MAREGRGGGGVPRISAKARVRARADDRVHGDVQGGREGAFAAVYALVKKIPRGRVMTYGQIATLTESRLSPRAVGWAMHGCPKGVPWQRVVNASGGCSTDRMPDMPIGMQRILLEAEGVKFSERGTLSLERYRWTPTATKTRSSPAGKRTGKTKVTRR